MEVVFKQVGGSDIIRLDAKQDATLLEQVAWCMLNTSASRSYAVDPNPGELQEIQIDATSVTYVVASRYGTSWYNLNQTGRDKIMMAFPNPRPPIGSRVSAYECGRPIAL